MSTIPPEGVAGDAALERLVLRVVAGLVALVLSGGFVAAFERLSSRDGPKSEASFGPRRVALTTGPGAIGPLAGTPIASYIGGRAGALAAARGRHGAVVSFDSYLSIAEALDELEGNGITPEVLFVAMPGGRPLTTTPDVDLGAVVASTRREAAEERRSLKELLPTVDEPDFAAQYRAEIVRLDRVLAAPAAVPRGSVFGVAVRAEAAQLRALATSRRVRVIDIGEVAGLPAVARLSALRPEEMVRAGEPPTRPIN